MNNKWDFYLFLKSGKIDKNNYLCGAHFVGLYFWLLVRYFVLASCTIKYKLGAEVSLPFPQRPESQTPQYYLFVADGSPSSLPNSRTLF
jgi:hypothetical protein